MMGSGLKTFLGRRNGSTAGASDGYLKQGAKEEKYGRDESCTARAKAVMHVKLHDCDVLKATSAVAVLLSKRLSGSGVGDWKELDRLYLSDLESRSLHTFQAVFYSGEEKLLRIELRSVAPPDKPEEKPQFLGAAETLLLHVWQSQEEWTPLKLKETGSRSAEKRPYVSVVLEPLKILNHSVMLDIVVTVKKKKQWPFSSARPFFVVYRSELDGTWTPLYRSEVLLRPTDRKGAMAFRTIDFKGGRLNDYNDNRPLRIEFLHYKLHGNNPRSLGYVETSIAALRQSAQESKLALEVNQLSEGNLSGSLTLRNAVVNSAKSHFFLDATFGQVNDDYVNDTVFLDMTCTVERTEAWPFNSSRLFFVVSRICRDRSKVIYTSEVASKPDAEGGQKFDLVKLNRQALTRESSHCDEQAPVVKLELFHYKPSGGHVLLGHVSTTLETLRQVPPQGMLLFHSNVIPEGCVRGKVFVEQAEVSASQSYFVLHFQIGRTDVRRRLYPVAVADGSVAAAKKRPGA